MSIFILNPFKCKSKTDPLNNFFLQRHKNRNNQQISTATQAIISFLKGLIQFQHKLLSSFSLIAAQG